MLISNIFQLWNYYTNCLYYTKLLYSLKKNLISADDDI